MTAWAESFRLLARSRTRSGKRVVGADVTTWQGRAGGEWFVIRITPRPRVEGLHFLVSSNHRIRAGEGRVGSSPLFLDVEVLRGSTTGEAAATLAALIADVETNEGGLRPVRLRRPGERFRSGRLLTDVFEGRDE